MKLILLICSLALLVLNCSKQIVKDDNLTVNIYHQVVRLEKDIKEDGKEFTARASGFVVNKKDNVYIAGTAAHFCKNMNDSVDVYGIALESDNIHSDGKVIFLNEDFDLCFIMFKTKFSFHEVKFAQTHVNTGDFVYSIGSPAGVFPVRTDGYVTKQVFFNDDCDNCLMFLSSVASTKGSSGSPVFNKNNELVGMIIGANPKYHHDSLAIDYQYILHYLRLIL